MPASVVDKAVADHVSLTEDQLIDEIKSKADEVDGNGFAWLVEVEELVCESLGVPSFEALGRGSFMKLLSIRPQPWLNARVGTGDEDPGRTQSGAARAISWTADVSRADLEVAVVGELAKLAELAQDLGSTVHLLHRLEVNCCKHLEVASFDALGNGPSIVAFLASAVDPKLRAFAGASRPAASAADVVSAVEMMTSVEGGDPDDGHIDIAATIQEAFGVSDVAAFGCGTVADIQGRVRAAGGATPMQEPTVANLALICPLKRIQTPDQHRHLDFSSRELAIRCIALCPAMIAIETHLHWKALFERHHGDILSFCSSIKPSELPESTDIRFVQPRHGGHLVLLDRKPNREKFSAALSTRNAQAAAAQLVALLVEAGSYAAMSTKMLESYVRVVAGSNRSDDDAIEFLLRVLAAMPRWGSLRSTLAPILLHPLQTVLNVGGARRNLTDALVQCATKDAQLLQAIIDASLGSGSEGALQAPRAIDTLWALLNTGSATSSVVKNTAQSQSDAPAPARSQSDAAAPSGQAVVPAVMTEEDDASGTANIPAIDEVQQMSPSSSDPLALTQDVQPAGTMLDREATARAVIESIREETGDRTTKVWSTLQGALKRISTDLYSEESHFTMELIQNADDNKYAPGVEPDLTFVISLDEIIVSNNEIGFEEKHVRALCDVGKSTKVRQLRLYFEPFLAYFSATVCLNMPKPQTRAV